MPTNLIGIYAEYKEDTDIIASWLASCARLCGYPTEKLSHGSWDLNSSSTEAAKPSRRLKGKELEQARQATNPTTTTPLTSPKPYILALTDFVPLAHFIVRSTKPIISISPAVVSVLDRAILARSNFGQILFKQQDIERDTASDSTHQHFVVILEKVRKILLSKVSPASSATDKVDVLHDLTNRFNHLEIQVPSPNVVNPEPKRQNDAQTNGCSAAEDTTEYIAEEPSSLSDALAAYCMLLHDVATIRDTIKHIWTGVRDGTIDYAAAAIGTDAAVGMIRDLEDTVSSVMEPHGGIVKMMKLVVTRWLKEDSERSPQERYELALHHCLVPVVSLDKLLKIIPPDDTTSFLPAAVCDFNDEVNIYGVGFAPDFRWLDLCISDGAILAQCLEEDQRDYPAMDMFVRGIQDMARGRVIPFYAIIAAQINLDIHHVLAKKTKDVTEDALRELSELKKDVSSELDSHGDDEGLRNLLTLFDLVLSDPIKHTKDIMRDGYIHPARAHQTLKLLPVLTGQIVHQFRVAVYQVAVRVANHVGSIQYAVQLYHALRTEGLVKTAWPDLDHVRTILGESNFFLGSPPKSIPEYMAKFGLHAGLSPAAIIRQGRNKKKGNKGTQARETDRSQYTSTGPRIIAKGDYGIPLSKKFIELSEARWNRALEEWPREYLRDILSTFDVEPIHPTKTRYGSGSPSDQEKASDSRLRRILLKLTEALHDESRRLRFPLLKVHETSWEFLTTVRDRCGPMLRAYFREPRFAADNVTWYVAGYIFSAACRAGDKNRIGLPLEQIPDLGPLKLAGEICEGLLTGRKDFGTRALRWMEGNRKEDAQGQEVEDTSVEHQDVEDTGLNDGLERPVSFVRGPDRPEPPLPENTESKEKDIEDAGVEIKSVASTAVDTYQVKGEGTIHPGEDCAATEVEDILNADVTPRDS